MDIGRRVAAARALQRKTQDQLARDLTRISGEHWSRNDVAGIENGRRSLKAADLPLFAAAQEQDFGWYLDGVTASLPDALGKTDPGLRHHPPLYPARLAQPLEAAA